MAKASNNYLGALHVHTDHSDGDGTVEEVVEAARHCGLNFVVLTDHNTRGLAEEIEGWHEGVLVLCGEEVTTPEGHFLAFESAVELGPMSALSEALAKARSHHASVVSVHHQLPHPVSAPLVPPALSFGEADLAEIWSFTDDFLTNTGPMEMVASSGRPGRHLRGPSRRLLRAWDRELRKRPLPIVGGLNIHQRKQPLLDWRMFFPYQAAFRSLCTVVQVTNLPPVDRRACDLVWNALREGRCFLINREVSDGTDFLFEFIDSHGNTRRMGDTVAYDPRGRFHIRVPEEAEVVLRHNSQPFFWGTAVNMSFPVGSPGSYRVEVYLDRHLWILSNPIRLSDEDGTVLPTVSDVT